MTVAAFLLLGLLAGCSSSTPPKTVEQPAPVASTVPASTAAVPAPAASTPVSESPKPAPKKPPKTEGKESGSPMDRFAKCLAAKDATMYGVFWCDHCREQKEKFGDSFKYVKYVECVTQDAPHELIPVCKAQGIKHTPTWIFSDGSRLEGAEPLATLAEKTGCKAP